MNNKKINIAIFASGNGSNTQAILEYFKGSNLAEVKCIYSNNPTAYVLERAKNFQVDTYTFSRKEFYESESIINHLQQKDINLIVLAGFMWLVPEKLVDKFTIINIHPALLPNYGGKGMYGHFVHEAVIKNKETYSGITIHYVNKEYDKGDILLQETCPVLPNDTPDILAERIHSLEHLHFSTTIEKLVQNLRSQSGRNV